MVFILRTSKMKISSFHTSWSHQLSVGHNMMCTHCKLTKEYTVVTKQPETYNGSTMWNYTLNQRRKIISSFRKTTVMEAPEEVWYEHKMLQFVNCDLNFYEEVTRKLSISSFFFSEFYHLN